MDEAYLRRAGAVAAQRGDHEAVAGDGHRRARAVVTAPLDDRRRVDRPLSTTSVRVAREQPQHRPARPGTPCGGGHRAVRQRHGTGISHPTGQVVLVVVQAVTAAETIPAHPRGQAVSGDLHRPLTAQQMQGHRRAVELRLQHVVDGQIERVEPYVPAVQQAGQRQERQEEGRPTRAKTTGGGRGQPFADPGEIQRDAGPLLRSAGVRRNLRHGVLLVQRRGGERSGLERHDEQTDETENDVTDHHVGEAVQRRQRPAQAGDDEDRPQHHAEQNREDGPCPSPIRHGPGPADRPPRAPSLQRGDGQCERLPQPGHQQEHERSGPEPELLRQDRRDPAERRQRHRASYRRRQRLRGADRPPQQEPRRHDDRRRRRQEVSGDPQHRCGDRRHDEPVRRRQRSETIVRDETTP